MSEPQSPHLSVVEPAPAEVSEAPRSRVRSALPWLLLVAALAFAWLWLSQLERSRELAGRVAAVEVELADARADLASWQTRMEGVRGGIERVASEVDALRALASGVDALPSPEPVAEEGEAALPATPAPE